MTNQKIAAKIANTANVYYGPKNTYDKIQELATGADVIIVHQISGFALIEFNHGVSSWLRGYVETSKLNNYTGTIPTLTPLNASKVLNNTNSPTAPYSVPWLNNGTFLASPNIHSRVTVIYAENLHSQIEYTTTLGELRRGYVLTANLWDKLTLAQLQAKFPHGKYWNHLNASQNNQEHWTTTGCSSHTNTNNCNAFNPSGTNLSWQCVGFADKCGYDSTGINPRSTTAGGWTVYESTAATTYLDNQLKPGDIVRYYSKSDKSSEHAIFVTGVSGSNVTFGDCNSDGKCGIKWNTTKTKAFLKTYGLYKVQKAPQTLI